MNITIRDMQSDEADQKGYVHWKTWQETYTGLIDEQYLANQTLEKCQDIARRWPENTLVAELDGKIVGFNCYGKNESDSGEVVAIYILKEAQGFGIGRKLMDAALEKLAAYDTISLWVLKGNERAIGFYEHYGFRMNGEAKELSIGTELRMIYCG